MVILLHKFYVVAKKGLHVDYSVRITGNTWEGVAHVPLAYLPRKVYKMDAFALHDVGKARKREAYGPMTFNKYSDADLYVL